MSRLIDLIPDDKKFMVCDNCLDNDTCKNAYTGLFNKRICSVIFNDLKYEILEMEDEEEDEKY